MTSHNNNVYLNHIIACIDQINHYVNNAHFEEFASNQMMVDAVIRNFEVMGEAANKLSNDFREKYSQVDFRPATNMRNRLIHGYDDINLDYIWETIRNDLPELKEAVEKILNSL